MVVRAATAKQEMRLTAPMDGLNLSRGPGCDTPAPKNITGSWNTFGGLNRKSGLFSNPYLTLIYGTKRYNNLF